MEKNRKTKKPSKRKIAKKSVIKKPSKKAIKELLAEIKAI